VTRFIYSGLGPLMAAIPAAPASLFAQNRSGVKYTVRECALLNKKYRSTYKMAYEMILKNHFIEFHEFYLKH